MALSAPLSVGEGVGGRHHLHLKRAFLRIKERLPSHQRNAPFVCKQYYSLPLSITSLRSVTVGSERGEAVVGAGMRLFSTQKKWLNDSLLWHFEHGIHRWHEGAKRHRAPKGTWESTEAHAHM